MKLPDSKTYRVALLIDTSMSWGVRIVKGIHEFAQQQGHWLLHVEPRGRYETLAIPAGWTGEGIIARVNRQRLADEIVASQIPTVNVSWYDFPGPHVARCTVDEQQTGRLAAEYFLGIGFQHFGYCGPYYRPDYRDLFCEEYHRVLQQAGYACDNYRAAEPAGVIAWNEQLHSLVEWLNQLPRPAAVLCWSAARGRQVTEACQYANIRVPDEIAVLGGEHDDLMKEISDPPLSTIDQPAERVGFEAAKILSQMMRGEPTPVETTLLPPSRVIVRHSTDVLAIDDEVVRTALRLIQAQARDGINVAQLVSQMMIARRALEQRFAQHLGRTPAAEIRRVRIELAKQLLVETDLTMSEVAHAAGFSEQDLFSRALRRTLGMTPTQFRSIHRTSPSNLTREVTCDVKAPHDRRFE